LIALGKDPNDKCRVESLIKYKDNEIQVLKSKLKNTSSWTYSDWVNLFVKGIGEIKWSSGKCYIYNMKLWHIIDIINEEKEVALLTNLILKETIPEVEII
jgi:hypothetical protein